MTASTPPVFLVAALPSGERAVLDGEEAHHAVTVRRTRPGELLTLSDGAGGLAECEVEAVHPGRDARLDVRIRARRHEPEPVLRVTIAQALAKGDRGELAVELATEAGADAVLPWRAARSIARWDEGPRGAKALGKWRATARAAAKQARRGRLPDVGEPVTTTQLAEVLAKADRALVLDATGPVITEVDLPERGELVLVVGPEGGITAEEFAAFAAAGATTVRLGQTVLRTSTAGAVALGALGALTARWR
ncbi:16S rRNA (uracil(1498)-N(3))-methyltransferase [Prauserella muralis]|uniref:Ribosomal RNA small subunit methyltransferase E n=1 Tax=Prauserella muralis TaxID=588067 RepID=A0A2V4B0U4_9PSEU|nr:16S rRNA (uracil(1498)-N(3))-methyltransferase [Prauserella muralis]PXY27637.1 16S rRNA (uracil(1498)-N(3))-methyltransferase [Prauserella muralis]TWE22628.1 16S rRNA (uracil1498-N3)-methyltransferase [Prauserella muralis]